MQNETATFAGGCFWGVEEAFRTLKGVISTSVGYTGGTTKQPTYEDVCSDATGHAEAVQVTFDPKQISYEQLLDVFWNMHDPTQRNKQEPDVGSQYRSVIFYHNAAQKKAAEASLKKSQKTFSKSIVTQIIAAKAFYKAEEYHQQYLAKRNAKVCH